MSPPFPPDFVFGAATSAYQVEGNLENDWSAWERAGKLKDKAARNGRGCAHWERFEQDLSLIEGLGATAYRLSLEWARVEPERGKWHDAALNGYRERLLSLTKRGIRPVVTLHHFTHPSWFHATTPWHEPSSLVAWKEYVTRVAPLFDGLDAAIITINEPMVFLLGGYLSGLMPPGLQDGAKAQAALTNLVRAHAVVKEVFEARTAIKLRDVGISQNVLAFAADRKWHPIDQALTRLADGAYNHAFLEALHTGRLTLRMPGVMNVSTKIDGAERSMTFCGVNYYTRAHLRFTTQQPFVHFTFRDPHKRGLTDIEWEYYPEGFDALLRQMKRYEIPVWVTENGLDDRTGTRRSQFLYDHWKALLAARADGVNVTTYLHWSLMDNFEWLEAWGPRFGLYRVDFETLERTPTPAVDYFRRVATSRTLSPP